MRYQLSNERVEDGQMIDSAGPVGRRRWTMSCRNATERMALELKDIMR